MENVNILWADDEIDLLKPHVLFLESKGYLVETVNNGTDAVEKIQAKSYDIVFLDENMPGLSGLDALAQIKEIRPSIPVIMITKSEEESIMEDAIGSKIADYLIKPVNPNQILLSLKKNLDNKRLVQEKTSSSYQQEFRAIGAKLAEDLDFEEWSDIYKKLIYWELELQQTKDSGLEQVLNMQKEEANNQFFKYIQREYLGWLNPDKRNAPLMSHTIFQKRIWEELKQETPVYLLLIDNLRFDQWRVLSPVMREYFKIKTEEIYCSILPTATQYARNAIFSGLLPSEIEKKFPDLWKNDDDDDGKNLYEEDFLKALLSRVGYNKKMSYHKITNLTNGKKLVDNFANLSNNDFNVIVYNFVDMLSHARTEMEVLKELANDEAAYRSLTLSWFEHSPLLEMIKKIKKLGAKIIITTDHGTVKVTEPSKIVGDKNTNSNLRYKQGKNLTFNSKDVFWIKNPSEAYLPKANISTSYVFAKHDKYFVYPNNYNHYVGYYHNTFQHGGISLEEMLIPYIVLEP
jgi:CheY-like chemotaxis protein